jgi:Tfp pilus assembly protein FimT
MTAATLTTRFEGHLAEENVNLTVTDGETFVSKLSTPLFCHITSSEDMGAETNSASYTISGRTITIYADGVTDKLMTVTVKGRL